MSVVGVGRIGDPDQHRDDTGARGEPGQLERIGPLRAARDDDPAGSCRGCLKAVARPLGGGDHGVPDALRHRGRAVRLRAHRGVGRVELKPHAARDAD